MNHEGIIYNNFESQEQNEPISNTNEDENKKNVFNYDRNRINPFEEEFQDQVSLFPILDAFKIYKSQKENFSDIPVEIKDKIKINEEVDKTNININEEEVKTEIKKEDKEIKERIESKEEQTNKEDKSNVINKKAEEKKESLLEDEIEEVKEKQKEKVGNENKNNKEIEDKNHNNKKDEEKGNMNNLNEQNSDKGEEKEKISEQNQMIEFIFDKETIVRDVLKNKINQEGLSLFKIYENYKKKAIKEVEIGSDSLITKKPLIPPIKKYFENFQIILYEKNNILPIKKNETISKINLKEINFCEIEKINEIIEGNKNINIFGEKEMLCERPTIFQEDKEEKEEKMIYKFKTMMNNKKLLYDKYFNFGTDISPKIIINEDDTENISLNHFSPNNPIFTSYEKKNIKSFINNSDEKVKKIKISFEEDNEEKNTISGNNIRRLNKIKFLKTFDRPNADNNRVSIKNPFFNPLFFKEIDNNYEETNIKSFLIQNDVKINKINNGEIDNIITEIFYSYNHDKEYSKIINLNINLELNESLENSIEDIHDKYIKKNVINVDLYNDYSQVNDIDVLYDIDLDSINKKYEKFKEKREKQKKKYLFDGNASLQLMKDSLSQEIYNNSETALLHNMSLNLKKVDSAMSNDELKMIGNYSENNLKGNNLKCAKKLKKELNRSLMNKYMINNMTDMKKNNSEKIKKSKDINDINNNLDLCRSHHTETNVEKDKVEKIMKKIKKIDKDANKIEKKKYINKLKFEQDKKIEQEIQKEKKIKYVFPISISIFFIIPFLINFYQKYTEI